MKIMLFCIILLNLFSVNLVKASSNNKNYIKMLLIDNAKKSNYVKPSLALAIAQVESNFNTNAISNKGAIGVMQIMPKTARDLYGIPKHKFFDPIINIKIGISFLDHLIKKYKGRIDIALSHYNGGSAVGKWPNVKIIPATYNYVLKVLNKSSNFEKNNIKHVELENNRKLLNKRYSNNLDYNLAKIDEWLDIYKDIKDITNNKIKNKL